MNIFQNKNLLEEEWKLKDEIPDTTNLATNTTPNAKINEIKNEMPNIANLATTAALNQ